MALQKGTYTALQAIKPITTDLSGIISDAFDRKLRREGLEEQKAARLSAEAVARAKASTEARKELRTAFNTGYDKLVDVVVGTKYIDEAMGRGVGAAKDLFGTTFEGIKDDPSLLDDNATQMRIGNLKQYSTNLATISKAYAERGTALGEGLTDGTISSWFRGELNDFSSIFEGANLDIGVDPETGLPVGVIAKTDNEGEYILGEDGKPVLEKLPLVEILDGRGLPDLFQPYDFETSVREMGAKASTRGSKIQTGFTTKTVQNFEQVEAEVRDEVKSLLGTSESPSIIAKSVWADAMGMEPVSEFTEDDMKEIEDHWVQTAGLYYDELNEVDIDQAGALAARKKRGGGKGTVTPSVVLNTDSGKVESYVSKSEANKGKSGFTVSFGNALKTKKTESTAEYIENVHVLADGSIEAEVHTSTRQSGTDEIGAGDASMIELILLSQMKGWKTTKATKTLTTTDFTNLAKNENLVDENGEAFANGKTLMDFLKNQSKSAGGTPYKAKTETKSR